MKFSDFSLLNEDEDSYHIGHPEGRSMQVAKSGLSESAQKLISQLKRAPASEPESMKVEPADIIEPEPVVQPEVIPEPVPAPIIEPVIPQEDSLGTYKKDLQAGINTQKEALNAEAQGFEKAKQEIEKRPNPVEIFKAYQKSDGDFADYVRKNPINNNRYWENLDTGSKIQTGVALFLGGLGQGLVGGENPAIQFLQKAIDRDIEKQKADHSDQMNLWKMNRLNSDNDMEATLKTNNQALILAKIEAEKQQALAKSGAVAQKGAELILEADQKIAKNNELLSLMKAGNTGQTVSNVDPAHLVPLKVPPTLQKEAYLAIKKAQDIVKATPKILKAFDEAAQQQTVLRTGGGLRTSAGLKALHALISPFFEQLDGTVAKAPRDKILESVSPSSGDLQDTTDSKRRSLLDWIQTFSSAPLLKGNGIDLDQFKSTKPILTDKPGNTVIYKGKRYRIGEDGDTLEAL